MLTLFKSAKIGIGILLFFVFLGEAYSQSFPCRLSPYSAPPRALLIHTTSTRIAPTFSESCFQFGSQAKDRIFTDYSNLYNCKNVKNYGLALMGASVLANTKLDRNFQNWHQQHIRSDFSDECSKVAKFFGEGQYFLPIMATSAITYRFLQERHGMPACTLGEFTDRTARGYLVGAPALLTFQVLLGGDRPKHGSSYWRPFREDHGVSGHAFLGAVPFITAAQMTDRPCVKGLLYVLSTCTAWSRINDDQHYLSQVLLGWYLAYLSVKAVSETEKRFLPQGLTVFPVTEYDSVGAGFVYRY